MSVAILAASQRPRVKTYSNAVPIFFNSCDDELMKIGQLQVFRNVSIGMAVSAEEALSDQRWIAIGQNELDILSYARMRAEIAAAVESPLVGGVTMLPAKKVASLVMFCLGVFGFGCILTHQVMTPIGASLLAVFCFFVSYQMWKDSEEGGYRH